VVPKITTGAGLRGALDYDFHGRQRHPPGEWVAGTLIGTPREMSRQAAAFRSLRPDCKSPVFRVSLNLPASDGRQSPEKWEKIARDFLRGMGVPPTAAWCAIRHQDRDHDHIHLSILRTLPDGTLWNQEHSARRAIKVCEQLEKIHDLNTHSRAPAERKRPTRAEIEISLKQKQKGAPMTREKIQDSVDQILKNHPDGIDFFDLQKQLAAENIDVQAYAPHGKLIGVSYLYDSFKWPGSKVGRAYSAGLIERGVRYQAEAPATPPASEATATAAPSQARPNPWDNVVVPARQSQNRDLIPAGVRHLVSRPAISSEKMALRPGLQAGRPAWYENAKTALSKPLDPSFEMQPHWIKAGAVLLRALALVGLEAAKFTAEMAAAIWQFVRRILAVFGIKIGSEQVKQFQQPPDQEQPKLEYQPQAGADEEAAAEAVAGVAESLKNKDFQALPEVDGRSELIDQLTSSKPATLDFLSADSDSVTPAQPPQAPPDSVDFGDPFVSVKQAGAEFLVTWKKVAASLKKPNPPLDFSAGMLLQLDLSKDRLKAAQAAWDTYKKAHPIQSQVMDGPEKQRLAAALADVEHKKIVLADHLADLKIRLAQHNAQPKPEVPPALLIEAQAARAKFKAAQEHMRRRMILLIADIQDQRISARMRDRIASIFDLNFASVEREGSAAALASGLEKISEIRAEAEALARQAAAPRPAYEEDETETPRG